MTGKILLGFALTLLLGTQKQLQCQSERKETAHIEIMSIRAIPQVYVSLIVHTRERDVFIPYCSETEGGEKILCNAGSHLQILTAEGWRAAKLRTKYGVLGAASLERFGATKVPSKSEAVFVFQFSRRFFEVLPGQKLRVVVDAWLDKESIKAGIPSIPITSSPFECPQIGTGQ